MGIPARYFDGLKPVPRAVDISRAGGEIIITLRETGASLRWMMDATVPEAEGAELRLMHVRHGADTGERLIVEQAAFEAEFGGVQNAFRKHRAGDVGGRTILVWSLGAIGALAFLFFVGLPLLARYGAPLIAWRFEASLGRAVEPQVLELFGQGKKLTFCGAENGPGRAALAKMVERLTAGVELPGPLKVDVADTATTNAFALPGGRIFLFRPIIEKAGSANEVAGVLAHEIGHVIHRDAMRALLHDGALSIMIGFVLGDVTGGTTIAILGKMMLGNAYSRDNEREADEVSVRLMRNAGADPKAINAFFRRLGDLERNGKLESALNVFNTHPVTKERVDRVEQLAAAGAALAGSILSETEWQALKTICAKAP